MSHDLLESAARALRETSAEPQPRSGLTRARILDSAQKRQAPRSLLVRWLIGISAALAASTALARVAEHWPEIKEMLAPAAAEPVNSAAKPGRRARPAKAKESERAAPSAVSEGGSGLQALDFGFEGRARSQTESPEPGARSQFTEAPGSGLPASGSEIGSGASARGERAPRPRRARALPAASKGEGAGDRSGSSSSTATATSTVVREPAPSAESAELALFRRAERLHLAHDSAAVAAWDDYLRVAGQGVLAPEARYNRALALVRQGRIAEARHALGVFARGELGGYRRVEAQRLLQALAHRPDQR